MKPYEQFVENILGAVRNGQGKDPAAATALIQEALQKAGLMGASPTAARTGAQPFANPFGDLKAAPAWARGMPAAKERSAEALGPGAFLEGSYANEAGTRRYRLYVPSRPAEGPRPLVVMLHGCTQNPEDFAAGTTMNLAAEQSGCLVLYPEQPSSANHTQCWNWFDAAHQQRGQGEPAIIAGMTRQVLREQGGDPARVFVAGLSAGGAMAAVMAASYPELYGAVGVHSGLAAGSARDLITGLQAMKGNHKGARTQSRNGSVRAIVFHGDRDATVHPSNGQDVYRQFGGASGTEIEEPGKDYLKTMALDVAGKVAAEHWLLHGAGHAWSGGSTAGSYADPSGPNASAEMLRFFLAR
jgi:poly(hydroxyalkanoate) depolymerase family esterase